MSAKILTAIHEVMQKCSYVQRTGKNVFHGYTYASEFDLLDKLGPAINEAGLIIIPSLDGGTTTDAEGNTHLVMSYTLAHIDGDVWPEKLRFPGCGNDRAKNGTIGDKGTYKAVTGAHKYMLSKLFRIATGDDPENDNGVDGSSNDIREAPDMKEAPDIKEAPDMKKDDASVASYVQHTLKAIDTYKTADALKEFWYSHKQVDMRGALGIVEGSREFTILHNAAEKRNRFLKQTVRG